MKRSNNFKRSTSVFFPLLIAALSFYSCGGDDNKGGNSFSCDNYWSKVNLNSICNLGFPSSFTFDTPPQAGATTICLAHVLKNTEPDYIGTISIFKTPSNANALSAYNADKNLVHSDNELEDFDAGGEVGFRVKIAGTERYDYSAVKGAYWVQYTCVVQPDMHACLTLANHDAYMIALVASL
ncbi:MAG: hypothetical protein UZ12_BCD005002100 [Bacteroidetes bacterium OLB12]|nr:MAG: hypothetical protein UZ12_BCD005002100 [Bacteroidetes bacterium OLB12]HNR74950.1 hypothetical protein [Cyclobacteriaceae bacterium]HNU41814.1 hypothetical protein [Cyclobacteriaceae bacterium]